MDELAGLAERLELVARQVAFRREDIDDARQDAWVGALRAVRTWDPEGGMAFLDWLTFKGRVWAQQQRDREPRRAGTRAGRVTFWADLPDAVSRDDDPTDRVAAVAALEQLPEPRRFAVVAAAYGWTQTEIAAELGVSQMTISRWLRDAVTGPG